jgi:uncharacterized damage-inducible protein DinB
MQTSDVVTLFDYNYWATERILEAAGRLSPAQYIAPAGLSHGSIRGALVHCLSAERTWRIRCQERQSPTTSLAEADFPTLEALRALWGEEEAAMRGYVAGLSEADLAGDIDYANTKGEPFRAPLWGILSHVVNHGTQCRSEAAVALTAAGASPGDLDLIMRVRTTL